MKFKFTPTLLRSALSFCDSLIEERSPVPQISNLYLSIQSDLLTMVATDLTSTILQSFPVSSDLEITESGSILVPATPFARWVSRVDAPVRAVLDGTSLRLKSGTSTLTLKTMPSSEYPPISFTPSAALGTLPATIFADALKKALISADPQDSIPIRNSIAIDKEWVVSSDGTRFSGALLPTAFATDAPLLIPRDTAAPLMRAISGLDEISLSTDGRRLIISAPGFEYAIQLYDNAYIDWRSFFLNEPTQVVTVLAAELRSAVLRISDSRSEVPWIHFGVAPSTLTLDNHVVGNDAITHAIESITIDSSVAWDLHANLVYIKDILSAISSRTLSIGLLPLGDNNMLFAADDAGARFIVAPMSLGGG